MNTRKYHEILNGKKNIVGKIIQDKRVEQKISRQFLSDRLMNIGIDLPEHTLYEIETGKRTIVDYELGAISKLLKTTSDELLSDFYNDIDL